LQNTFEEVVASQYDPVPGSSDRLWTLDPASLGIAPAARDDLRGGDAAVNAAVFRDVLGGAPGPVRDAVLLNAAGAVVAFDGPHADPLAQFPAALERVARAVDSGAAAALLGRWAEFSTAFPTGR